MYEPCSKYTHNEARAGAQLPRPPPPEAVATSMSPSSSVPHSMPHKRIARDAAIVLYRIHLLAIVTSSTTHRLLLQHWSLTAHGRHQNERRCATTHVRNTIARSASRILYHAIQANSKCQNRRIAIDLFGPLWMASLGSLWVCHVTA